MERSGIGVEELIAAGYRLQRGTIVEVSDENGITVRFGDTGPTLKCDFLRTSAAPPPPMEPGSPVLCAVDESRGTGLVIGTIETFAGLKDAASRQPGQPYREIRFTAEERIELTCGKSSLTMEKDGRVVLKGADVTSRASGVQKIKGSSVRIN